MERSIYRQPNQWSKPSNRPWYNRSYSFRNAFSFSYPFVNIPTRNWSSSSPPVRYPHITSNDQLYCYDNRVPNEFQNQQFNGQRLKPRNSFWKRRQWFDKRYALSEDIRLLYLEKRQSEYIHNRKLALRRLILEAIERYYDVTVVIVGSSANGLATMYSELDICVIFKVNVTDSVHALESICAILNRKDFVKNKRLILAKVPILKFIDSVSGTVVNINVNNRTCIRNTILIKTYTRMDERVAPLIVALKIWARQNGINDASNKTMNGYTLTLMVINFLQSRCVPALLPCLHKLMPEEFDHVGANMDVNWMNLYLNLPNFKTLNNDSIGDLFLQFLYYYAFEFDFRLNVVSVRNGVKTAKCEYLSGNKNEITQWKYICVEEPFDLMNTARSVSDKVAFDYIVDVFKSSYQTLNETECLLAIF